MKNSTLNTKRQLILHRKLLVLIVKVTQRVQDLSLRINRFSLVNSEKSLSSPSFKHMVILNLNMVLMEWQSTNHMFISGISSTSGTSILGLTTMSFIDLVYLLINKIKILSSEPCEQAAMMKK
jgi:hypothetical protein